MIALQRVAKSYGSQSVLREVTFTLAPKHYIAVAGEPGSGKTTIVRLLLRAEDPTSGAVTVDGAPLHLLPSTFLQVYRRQVGAISESVPLVEEWTVEENVAYPLRIRDVQDVQRRKRVADVLKRLDIQGTSCRRAGTLADAERQLTMLARAVVAQPTVLIADEPTAHLAPGQARLVLAILKEAHKRGTTVLLLTRDRSLASDAMHILQLSNGECIASARHRANAATHEDTTSFIGIGTQHARQAKAPSGSLKSGRRVRITSIGSDVG